MSARRGSLPRATAGGIVRHLGAGHFHGCVTPTVNSALVPLAFFVPGTLSAYRAYSLRLLQHDVARHGAHASLALAGRVRRRTSTGAFLAVLAAFCLAGAGIVLVRLLLVGSASYDVGGGAAVAQECSQAGVGRLMTIGWVAILVVLYASSILRLRRLPGDFYYQVAELRINALLSMVCLPMWWALGPNAPLKVVGATVVHASVWASVWACACVTTAVLWPAVLTWSPKFQENVCRPHVAGKRNVVSPQVAASSSAVAATPSAGSIASPNAHVAIHLAASPDGAEAVSSYVEEARRLVAAGKTLTLNLALKIPRLRREFAEHLETEFCSELIAFYLVTRGAAITQDAEQLGQSVSDRIRWIADTFVREGALMQVNISGEARDETLSDIDRGDAGTAVVFRRARLEVLDLLSRSSWPRFLDAREKRALAELVELPLSQLRAAASDASDGPRRARRCACCAP